MGNGSLISVSVGYSAQGDQRGGEGGGGAPKIIQSLKHKLPGTDPLLTVKIEGQVIQI